MTILIGITVYMTFGMAAIQASLWLSKKTCDYLDGLPND